MRVCRHEHAVTKFYAFCTALFSSAQGRELGMKLGKDLRHGDVPRDVALEDYMVKKAIARFCGPARVVDATQTVHEGDMLSCVGIGDMYVLCVTHVAFMVSGALVQFLFCFNAFFVFVVGP